METTNTLQTADRSTENVTQEVGMNICEMLNASSAFSLSQADISLTSPEVEKRPASDFVMHYD